MSAGGGLREQLLPGDEDAAADAGAGTNGYYNAEDTESEFSEGATELRFVEPLTPQEMDQCADAAIFLIEGNTNFKFENHPILPDHRKAFLQLNTKAFKLTEVIVASLFMAMAIIEYPAVWEAPKAFNAVMEVLIIIFLYWVLYMRAKASGGVMPFLKQIGGKFRIAIMLLITVDWILLIAVSRDHRVLRIVRPFFVLDSKIASGVRRVLRQIVLTMYHVFDMLLLLLFFILIWAVIGFYFFSDNADDPFFRTFDDSFVNLFILITTANYPDVMMPAFFNNRVSAFFFVIYLLIGLYFLLNLFLAVVYNNFIEQEHSKFKRMFFHRRTALRLAFYGVMDPELGGITFRTFQGMMSVYAPHAKPYDVLLAFCALDKKNTGIVQQTEFNNFFEIWKLRGTWSLDLTRTLGPGAAPLSFHDKLPPSIRPFFHTLRSFVMHRYFEFGIDLVIFINTVVLVIEAIKKGEGAGRERDDSYEYVFIGIYAFEALVKILGLGPSVYWTYPWNRFDFAIIALSIVGSIIERIVGDSTVGVFGTFLRAVRLLRLLKVRQTFRDVLTSMVKIMPRMMRFLIALVCVYYAFAIVGITAFNNTVTEKCSYLDCGSNYGNNSELHYELNNFNNLFYAYNTMFDLMVVNNWFLIMHGHVVATNKSARIFFFVFYLFAVIIVSNVIIAFILDAFQSIFPILNDIYRGHKSFERIGVRREVLELVAPEHQDSTLNCDKLYYLATSRLGRVDIYFTLYADKMKEWEEEEQARHSNGGHVDFRARTNTSRSRSDTTASQHDDRLASSHRQFVRSVPVMMAGPGEISLNLLNDLDDTSQRLEMTAHRDMYVADATVQAREARAEGNGDEEDDGLPYSHT